MAKSLQEGFDTLLGWVEPLASEQEKAKSHKDSVKSCLVNNFECTKFFETGSFGNGTGIRHFSDTDYFAVIPNKNLSVDSSYSLRKIKEALNKTFWKTFGIEVKCPAVKIPFGSYASETLEVTPCSFRGLLDTPLGKFAAYEIADCSSDWINSSPEAHNKYVKEFDEDLNYRLKPLIRLLKAWKYYNDVE